MEHNYNDTPDRDDIDNAIERAINGDWSLRDYDYTEGGGEPPTLTIELEYLHPSELEQLVDAPDAPKMLRATLGAVRKLEHTLDDAVPLAQVTFLLKNEYGVQGPTAEAAIAELKRRGEIYEPQTDHLRAV